MHVQNTWNHPMVLKYFGSYDGVASPPDGSSSSEHPGQSTMPFSFAGAIDAGAAKTADELLPTGMQEVSDPDTSEQGGAYSPGSYVNIETHHN